MTTDTIDALWKAAEKFHGRDAQSRAEQHAVLGRLVDAYQDAGREKKGLWLAAEIADGRFGWQNGPPGYQVWFWVGRDLHPAERRVISMSFTTLRAACDAAYCRYLTW